MNVLYTLQYTQGIRGVSVGSKRADMGGKHGRQIWTGVVKVFFFVGF